MTRDITKYQQDYNSHQFEETMALYRKKNVLEQMRQSNYKNILEIGCGNDSIINHYTSFGRLTIVEPSKIFIENVKKSDKFNSSVTIINDFFENAVKQIQNQTFDFVLLSSLLHEVDDKRSLLNAIKQVADENTIIRIDVPNSKSFHLIWAYCAGMIENLNELTPTAKKLQQRTVFDIDSLTELLNENGFEVIETGSYFIKPFNHEKMSTLISSGIISMELLDGLYKLNNYMPNYGSEIFTLCKKQI